LPRNIHNQITVAQQQRANVPEAEDEADEEPDTQSTNEENLANQRIAVLRDRLFENRDREQEQPADTSTERVL
jgi:hypothetical protein